MDKTTGKNMLTRCYRSYYNLFLKEGILNCSASGKKRGGDDHVRKAYTLIRFYGLTPPFVLSNSYLKINEM